MELGLLPAPVILIQVLLTERAGMSASQGRGFEVGYGIPAVSWVRAERPIGSENSESLLCPLFQWNSTHASSPSQECDCTQ